MLQKIIAFAINFLTLSSPYDWLMDIFKDARQRKFLNPLRGNWKSRRITSTSVSTGAYVGGYFRAVRG